MFRPIRWILFDAVGTLLYADPPVADVYYAAARRFGSRVSVAEIARRFRVALASTAGCHTRARPGVSDAEGELDRLYWPPTSESHERERWRSIVSQVLNDVDGAEDDLFEQLWQHFARPRHWRLFDDVPAAMEQLTGLGYRLAVASNFDARLRTVLAGHPPLATAFSHVFLSSELGFSKPDPRFFAAVTHRLGVSAGEILLVGDDERSDIDGARSASWHALFLCRDKRRAARGIRSLLDLPRFMAEL